MLLTMSMEKEKVPPPPPTQQQKQQPNHLLPTPEAVKVLVGRDRTLKAGAAADSTSQFRESSNTKAVRSEKAAQCSSASDLDDEEAECKHKTTEGGGPFEIPLLLTKCGRKKATPFPLKLMQVLCNEEYCNIISWSPTGRSFCIHNGKLLTEKVLPEFFKCAKYSSFTRKLHRWGFVRHYRGSEAGGFVNPHFQKGRFDLVDFMKPCDPPVERKPKAAKQKRTSFSKEAARTCSPKARLTDKMRTSHSPKQHKSASFRRYEDGYPVRQPMDAMSTPPPSPGDWRGRMLPGTSISIGTTRSNSIDNCLGVAIELEVSRRLEERLQALVAERQHRDLVRKREVQQTLHDELLRERSEMLREQELLRQQDLLREQELLRQHSRRWMTTLSIRRLSPPQEFLHHTSFMGKEMYLDSSQRKPSSHTQPQGRRT